MDDSFLWGGKMTTRVSNLSAVILAIIAIWVAAVVWPTTVNGFSLPTCQTRSLTHSYETAVSRLQVSVEDDAVDSSSLDEGDPSTGDFDSKRYSMTKINNIQVLTTNNNKKKTRPVTFFNENQDIDRADRRRERRQMPDEPPRDDNSNNIDNSNNGLLAVLESQQKELSSSLGALKQSLTEEQTKSQSLQERLERAEQIIAEQREQLRRATETQERLVRSLEARLGRAQDELKERLERERFLVDQKAELEQQDALEQQVESLQTELDQAHQESDQSQKEVDAVSTELTAARTQISSLMNELLSAQSKEDSYQGLTKNLQSKLDAARQKLAIKQQALTKTQRELAQAQTKLNLKDKLGGGKDVMKRDPQNRSGKTKDTRKTNTDSTGPSIFSSNFLGGAAAAAAASAAAKPVNSLRPPAPSTPEKKFQYPVIQNWRINEVTGEVTGIVRNHPQISDGTRIVTSSLSNTRMARANAVVVTKSGSRYQLATPEKKLDTKRPPLPKAKPNPISSKSPQSLGAPVDSRVSATDNEDDVKQPKRPPFNLFSGISNHVTSIKKEEDREIAAPQVSLTGEAVGNGKYLLAGRPKRKPSGRSEIVMAYLADENRNPVGDPLAIKFSTNTEKLRSEYSNYLKVQQRGLLFNAGDQQSPFVRWLDFMDRAEGSIKYAQHSAMVMELGVEDLREYRSRKGSMNEDEIKSALHTAARCIDTLHRSKLIWTDLKAENFVRMNSDDDGGGGAVVFKGVDLESAIPLRGNPLDYTPEASPPEFAKAYLDGEAYDFVLDYSYDIWSFGMLAYELVHGNGFFGKKAPTQIVKSLALDFQPPNIDHFEDEKLRDLVQRCLSLDPKKRPSASWVLNHGYFRGNDVGGMPRLFGW
jgi:Protein kinase domain